MFAEDVSTGIQAFLRGEYSLALKKFQTQQALNDKSAQWFTGLMYEKGLGVPQDYAEAAKYYKLSAQQNDSASQMALAKMYEDGRGLHQDLIKAHMWMNIATANNSSIARRERDRLEKYLQPKDIETAQIMAKKCINKNLKDCD